MLQQNPEKFNFQIDRRRFIAESNLIDKQDDYLGRIIPGEKPGDPMYVRHERAMDLYPILAARRPVSASVVLDLHRELTRGIDAFELRSLSGVYRTERRSVNYHPLPEPHLVSDYVDRLLVPRLREALSTRAALPQDALKQAWFCHDLFECIHPFHDGNGRTGRLLLDLILYAQQRPGVVVLYDDRKKYYRKIQTFRDAVFKQLISASD